MFLFFLCSLCSGSNKSLEKKKSAGETLYERSRGVQQSGKNAPLGVAQEVKPAVVLFFFFFLVRRRVRMASLYLGGGDLLKVDVVAAAVHLIVVHVPGLQLQTQLPHHPLQVAVPPVHLDVVLLQLLLVADHLIVRVRGRREMTRANKVHVNLFVGVFLFKVQVQSEMSLNAIF